MTDLMPYAHGLKWKLLLTGNEVSATFVGNGFLFKPSTHIHFQFKQNTSTSPPRTGDWVFIKSTSEQYALGWFVAVKAGEPNKHIVALASAHDIHFEIERRNFFSMQDMIAVRPSSECIRLSHPPPYRTELLTLATGTVKYMDRLHSVNKRQATIVETEVREREVRSKTNMLRSDTRRRQTRYAAIRALVKRFPVGICHMIVVWAELKDVY
jgi:hypothetical protein